MEAMHDFWCDSERAATPLCVEIAQRRAALEAGTPLPVHKSKLRRRASAAAIFIASTPSTRRQHYGVAAWSLTDQSSQHDRVLATRLTC
jgi:Holliday junction resolvase-like predicted endonuclease